MLDFMSAACAYHYFLDADDNARLPLIAPAIRAAHADLPASRQPLGTPTRPRDGCQNYCALIDEICGEGFLLLLRAAFHCDIRRAASRRRRLPQSRINAPPPGKVDDRR